MQLFFCITAYMFLTIYNGKSYKKYQYIIENVEKVVHTLM